MLLNVFFNIFHFTGCFSSDFFLFSLFKVTHPVQCVHQYIKPEWPFFYRQIHPGNNKKTTETQPYLTIPSLLDACECCFFRSFFVLQSLFLVFSFRLQYLPGDGVIL